jgi:Coenzyme PQQ synthesis protein D (PqqD)
MTTYTVPDDIIVTELDNKEAILLDMRNKMYFSLNETGLVIFKGIQSKLPDDKIIEELTSLYDINTDKARSSMDTLINQLLSHNIIEKHGT